MSDLQISLLSRINLDQSRVKPYEGFIFLCGGPTDITDPFPASLRDALYRELAKNDADEKRIRMAEHYKDWGHDSVYQDLVVFERHLAELSSLIVLILESPGALAELGLFSAIDEFRDKLIIFVDANYYKSNSFIKLGLIDFLEKTHKNPAEVHRWYSEVGQKLSFDGKLAAALQPELADSVRERLTRAAIEHQFDRSLWLHHTLLICDLIDLFAALTVREVRDILYQLKIERTEPEIRQALFLLERVGLLAMEPRGSQRFYVGVSDKEYLKLHFTERFDLGRFRSDILADYAQKDKKRFRAIQNMRASLR